MILLDQGGRREENKPFTPAEEESFQTGVDMAHTQDECGPPRTARCALWATTVCPEAGEALGIANRDAGEVVVAKCPEVRVTLLPTRRPLEGPLF